MSIIFFLVILFRNINHINISVAIYLIICLAGLITLNWGIHKIINEGSFLGIGLMFGMTFHGFTIFYSRYDSETKTNYYGDKKNGKNRSIKKSKKIH